MILYLQLFTAELLIFHWVNLIADSGDADGKMFSSFFTAYFVDRRMYDKKSRRWCQVIHLT